jgi:carbonic anhydrase
MENFIRRIHGTDVYFMTAMATAFSYERDDIRKIADFLDRRMITNIYIVNDTSCRFINSVIEQKMSSGSDAEKNLEVLLMENQKIIMKKSTTFDKVKTLTELNIIEQILNLREHDLIMSVVEKNKISIKGLITTKLSNTYVEVN